MSDLISRQAAIDAVGSMLRRKLGIGGDLAEITLSDLPTIDAAPVVRCKDCKHYWRNHADDISVSVCLASPKDDAFCSEGRRKDDAV